MDKQLVAKYLSSLKENTGLTYEVIAKKSQRSESTVKNLCLGKSDDPRVDTVAPVVYALGGSMDEMLNPEKCNDKSQNVTANQIREMYEYQLNTTRESNEEHIKSIIMHYEQHHEDLKVNYEHRLADKREIIDAHKETIETLKKECLHTKIAFWICIVVFISVLIAEVMNPNLGWIQF